MAVGVLGILNYYIYQSKKGGTTKVTPVHLSKKGDVTWLQTLETHNFEME